MAYPPGHPLYPFSPWPCPVPVGGPAYAMAPYDPAHLKGSPYEGGIRVPLIVAGAGVVPGSGSPRVSDALVDAVDVYETRASLPREPRTFRRRPGPRSGVGSGAGLFARGHAEGAALRAPPRISTVSS